MMVVTHMVTYLRTFNFGTGVVICLGLLSRTGSVCFMSLPLCVYAPFLKIGGTVTVLEWLGVHTSFLFDTVTLLLAFLN